MSIFTDNLSNGNGTIFNLNQEVSLSVKVIRALTLLEQVSIYFSFKRGSMKIDNHIINVGREVLISNNQFWLRHQRQVRNQPTSSIHLEPGFVLQSFISKQRNKTATNIIE